MHAGTDPLRKRLTNEAGVAGPEHVGGRGEKQFSAQRSPAAMTGKKLPGHREAERAKAGETSCSLEGWVGSTDKRCRKGQAAAVPAPSPAEPARHRAPGGQTTGRSCAGEKFRAQKAPNLQHNHQPCIRPKRASEGRKTDQCALRSVITVIKDPAHARRAVRRVIMLRMLVVIQDLVDILRIGSLQEHNLRPPLLEERGDLDILVHTL